MTRIVRLAALAIASLAPFDVFHFAGYSLDSASMIDEIRRVLGDPSRRTWAFPWGLVRAASPFSKMLRLAFEMRYLWDEQVVLDGTKLRATLPSFSETPLPEALTSTLLTLAARAGVPLTRSLGLEGSRGPGVQGSREGRTEEIGMRPLGP